MINLFAEVEKVVFSTLELEMRYQHPQGDEPLIVLLSGVVDAFTSRNLEDGIHLIRRRTGQRDLVIDLQERTAVSPDAALRLKRIDNWLDARGFSLAIHRPPEIIVSILAEANLPVPGWSARSCGDY
jgi:hypothetical protein